MTFPDLASVNKVSNFANHAGSKPPPHHDPELSKTFQSNPFTYATLAMSQPKADFAINIHAESHLGPIVIFPWPVQSTC